MSAADEEVIEGACYTAARRYPLQIGQWAGGGRIPGGPYTLTQLGVMIGGFVVLIVTRPLWGGGGYWDIAVVVVVPIAAGWVIHRVQVDHRNPVLALASLVGLAAAPAGGRLRGRAWRPAPSRRHAAQISVDLHPSAAPACTVAAAPRSRARAADANPPPRERAAVAPPAVAVSGVQALLAQRAAREGS
ncbi:hypothetical protein ACWERV_32770 [Streptomyces sp. NPDC004031]